MFVRHRLQLPEADVRPLAPSAQYDVTTSTSKQASRYQSVWKLERPSATLQCVSQGLSGSAPADLSYKPGAACKCITPAAGLQARGLLVSSTVSFQPCTRDRAAVCQLRRCSADRASPVGKPMLVNFTGLAAASANHHHVVVKPLRDAGRGMHVHGRRPGQGAH